MTRILSVSRTILFFVSFVKTDHALLIDPRSSGARISVGNPQGDTASADGNDSGSASPPPPRRRTEQISSYSWEDYGEEVRLTFRQSGWEWKMVEEEEISVEWGPRRFRLFIDSR